MTAAASNLRKKVGEAFSDRLISVQQHYCLANNSLCDKHHRRIAAFAGSILSNLTCWRSQSPQGGGRKLLLAVSSLPSQPAADDGDPSRFFNSHVAIRDGKRTTGATGVLQSLHQSSRRRRDDTARHRRRSQSPTRGFRRHSEPACRQRRNGQCRFDGQSLQHRSQFACGMAPLRPTQVADQAGRTCRIATPRRLG
jgi:hypothetical protein